MPVVVHDPATRVGVPEVNAVIDAVLRHDAADLASLVELTEAACIEREDWSLHPQPVCADGQSTGDLRAVFPVWNCEPAAFFSSLQEAQHSVVDTLDRAFGLYAIWEPRSYSLAPAERPPVWIIMFALGQDRGSGAWWLWIDERGAIIGHVRGGCIDLPVPIDQVTDPADRVILPPPAQPTATSP